ncbi:hypothetical protein FRC02_003190 [Tulasnella sp. 418]|nr:hypothetical protein FRC02_003190 [Tulasnella sp. 418]
MFEEDNDASPVPNENENENKKMPLLQEQDGSQIKCYIQQDLPETTIKHLDKVITREGGVVSSKIPKAGLVLVNPTTKEGRRLKEAWQTPDKPDRFVVCYTIIFASLLKPESMLASKFADIEPVFLEDNGPIKFYVDQKLDKTRRDDLLYKILKYGGANTKDPNNARVIIALETSPSFKRLRSEFEDNRNTYVETPEWLRMCIKQGEYFHNRTRPGKKRLREEYTEEDKQNLIEYIGKRVPREHMAGRQGNNLYIELCNNSKLWPWGQRHSWRSWRNHYQKNMEWFDVKIEKWLTKNPQKYGAKGQYLLQPLKSQRSGSDHEDQTSISSASSDDEEAFHRVGEKRAQPMVDEDVDMSSIRRKRPKGRSNIDRSIDVEDLMLSHLSGEIEPRQTEMSSNASVHGSEHNHGVDESNLALGYAKAAKPVERAPHHGNGAAPIRNSSSIEQHPNVKISASQQEQTSAVMHPTSTQVKVSASQLPATPRTLLLSQSDGKPIKPGSQPFVSLGIAPPNGRRSGTTLSADDHEIRNQLTGKRSGEMNGVPPISLKPRPSKLELDDEVSEEEESGDEEDDILAGEPTSDTQAMITQYKSMGTPTKKSM